LLEEDRDALQAVLDAAALQHLGALALEGLENVGVILLDERLVDGRESHGNLRGCGTFRFSSSPGAVLPGRGRPLSDCGPRVARADRRPLPLLIRTGWTLRICRAKVWPCPPGSGSSPSSSACRLWPSSSSTALAWSPRPTSTPTCGERMTTNDAAAH